MNLKETLIKRLRGEFYDKIYSRGRNYHSAGAVGEFEIGNNPYEKEDDLRVRAEVHGTSTYETSLFFNLCKMDFEGFECDCLYAEEDNCKHMAALGLKFIDAFFDFSEKYGGNINKQKFEDYLFSSSGAAPDPVAQLKQLFALGDGRSTQDILEEAKKILNVANSGRAKLDSKFKASPALPEKKKFKQPKTGINDFHLSVKFVHEYIEVDIHKSGMEYKDFKPDYLLEKKEILSSEQIELLEYLAQKKNWDDRLDPIRLLLLIEKSKMRYFKQDYYYGYGTKHKLQIIEGQKINLDAKLLDKSWVNENYDNREKLKFIFEMKAEDVGTEGVFFGENGVVLEARNHASICYLPKYALKILREVRDRYKYYNYGRHKEKIIELELSEEKMTKINEIIPELKETFNLTTDLSDNFEVKEYKNPISKIVVDYDATGQSLEVRPTVDYNFEKQNIGESVYVARLGDKNGRTELRRRNLFPYDNYFIHRKGNLIEWAKIEKEKEIKLARIFHKNLEATGFSKTFKLRKKSDETIFDFYENNWPKIVELCRKNNIPIEFEKDKFEIESADFKADFRVDMDAENDWLSFDVDCYCGKGKITLDVLREYIESDRQFIKKDGKLIRIENREELEKLIKMLESFHQREGQGFSGRVYHAPELEDVIGSQYYNSKVSKSFQKFMQEAKNGRPVEKVKIPAQIKKTLRDYQKEGLDWFYFLRKYRFGGILADDMGLGKTLQALSLIEMNKEKNKPSLVICPKTLLFNWEDEAAKFFPAMKTLVIQGGPKERKAQLKDVKKYDLVITSYPAVKKDKDEYAKLKFNYCFLDEAQFIKNAKTQNARAVKEINADYRLALTGTPLENSVSEIWSIFDFLMPGFLKKKKDFFERFEKPIMKESNAEALQTLKKKTACFMLRRTKEKVLKELPAKIEQASSCRLGNSQNVLYQEILANVKSEIFETVKVKGFSNSQIHILAGLTKLRQACNHPALLLKDKNHEKYESAKLEMFLEVVGEVASSGRKVLVFSQFTAMLDILSKELKKNDIDYHYLSGKTKNRKELVDDFNKSEDKKVFLISLKAGGTGLNLTSADNVIIFDPWWNPSVENQAIDRAHRIGQKKTVNVYRFITKGTIEEKIVALQEKKKFLFDNLVGESRDMFKKLTWDDVKELFQV